MNSPFTRIRKRRAPQRLKPDSHQNLPVPLRRSARLQSKQRSTSIPQSLLKHRPTAPQTSHTRLPTSDPIEEPVPSTVQLQEHPPHNHTHQTRKRGLDRSIEKGSERPSKRARLTERNLKAFEKMGRERKSAGKLSQARKLARSELDSSRSEAKSKPSSTSEASSKTVSSTDSRFPALAFENGIVDPVNSLLPPNLDDLQNRLDRARDTESPTESEYNDFSYRVQKAPNEMSMLLETSTLLKGYERGYRRVYNQALSDFPKNVGFNNGLSAAQPDMIEGLDLTQFGQVPVRRELGGAAVPTQESDPPTLPHLAGEWKGPGKDMILAQTQAAYDGACMVYGRNKARSFLESPDPDGHAYVHTFTTDGTLLNTYVHYSSQSQGQVKYHQYPTSTSLLRSSYEDFKTSRRRLRNVQDVAKENSETLRDELNYKWSASQQYIEDEDDEDDNDDGISLLPMSRGIQTKTAGHQNCDGYDYDDQDDGDDEPNIQLLTEYHASKCEDEDEDEDEDESFVQILTPDASSSASKRRVRGQRKKSSR